MRSGAFWIAVWVLVGTGQAQKGVAGSAPAVAVTAQAVLVEMASRAGVIFSGRVLGVERQDAAGYVDVRFGVDACVRGCAGKSVYVLREWVGLWTGEQERYRTGARLLMLLTARGPSGMSAPVDGEAGAIPLLAAAQPPVMDGQGRVVADTALGVSERVADLRWVQAKALRTMVTATATAAPGQSANGWAGPPAEIFAGGLLDQGPGLSVVLGWLHAAQ